MGARLCVLCPLVSPSGRDDSDLKKENQGRFCKILKRKMVRETVEKKFPNLALEDWILASPGFKPDYIIRSGEVSSSSSKSKNKVCPCVSQVPGSLIAEAKGSLCLDRPMNRHEEGGEEMLSWTSIGRSMSEKSQKRVSFKLPHIVIFCSPDELCSPEEEHEPYYSSENKDSFYSSICREYSFDSSAEEPFCRLAVDVLPHVFVSSKI